MADRDCTQQVVQALGRLRDRWSGLQSGPIEVHLGEANLTAVLAGALSPGERDYGREGQSLERLEQLYRELYDASRPDAERAVAAAVGREVLRSEVRLDALGGSLTLIFWLRT